MTLYALWPQRSSFPPLRRLRKLHAEEPASRFARPALRRCLYFSNITHILSYRIIFLQYNMGFYQK